MKWKDGGLSRGLQRAEPPGPEKLGFRPESGPSFRPVDRSTGRVEPGLKKFESPWPIPLAPLPFSTFTFLYLFVIFYFDSFF